MNGPRVSSVGDVNDDGYNDMVIGRGNDGYRRDVDDDGIDDLVIGGTGDDEAATDAGAVWVFVGGGM